MSLKKDFFNHIPKGFNDPVAGLLPKRETELSALLAYYHATNLFAWENVKLRSVSEPLKNCLANKYIQSATQLYCEYPLFSNLKQ